MNSQVKKLTFTALMAAMITIFTAYICHIPVGQNGGYIHFGDSLIYIAAFKLMETESIYSESSGTISLP